MINRVKRKLRRYSQKYFHKSNRNQWEDAAKNLTYGNQMIWTWEETSLTAPDYFQRLKFSVENSFGNVLEIGCGIGNMTRWLVENPKVNKVVAIDGFKEATDRLELFNLPKVEVKCCKVDQIELNDEFKIDTLLICETIEHLFLNEEIAMINKIKHNFNENARFIISTPIGYLYDPFHFREFSKQKFIKHIEKYYGSILKIDYTSHYSQVAFGKLNN